MHGFLNLCKPKKVMDKVKLYERAARCWIVNEYGKWQLTVYRHKITNEEHVALVSSEARLCVPLLLRIHSSCITGDIFHSLSCDCREQLDQAFKETAKEKGAIFYLFQEGRNIGLTNKIKAYALKEIGFDTREANLALGLPDDNRTYGMVGEMLDDLGVKEVKLMTNNPLKIKAVEALGIKVIRLPDEVKPNGYNNKYLHTKKANGHLLTKI